MNTIQRIKQVYAETGVSGLTRRAARVGILAAAAQLERASQRLLEYESQARLTSDERDILSQNRSLRGSLRGRRAFIVGNGPSLNQLDLEPLADEVTFGVNAFWKHPIIKRWQPTYYTVTDDWFFDGSEQSRDFFDSLRDRAPRSHFFTPLFRREIIRSQGLLPETQTHFIAKDGSLANAVVPHYDLTRVLPSPGTVLMTSMMIAMYMGASPIFILGADHDWLASPDEPTHFYEGKTLSQLPPITENEAYGTYRRRIAIVQRLWDGYAQLQELAAEDGLAIFNATAGGFLDVFPRARFESLFE